MFTLTLKNKRGGEKNENQKFCYATKSKSKMKSKISKIKKSPPLIL